MINETLFHDESAMFRAITGGAYNMPDAYGNIQRGTSFATKGTIPQNVLYAGTFKSTGKNVRGTSTEFTKILQGAFLYNGDVLRQVDYVVSDTLLVLKQAFPTDVSVATNVRICDRQFYKMIVCRSTHATDSPTLQESPFRPGSVVMDGGAPISYDASSLGEIQFDVHQ